MNTNHYVTLNVSQTATIQEIKESYRQLLLETHPDKQQFPSSTAAALKKKMINQVSITELKESYRVLSDLKLRNEYDLKLNESRKLLGVGGGESSDGLDVVNLDEFEEMTVSEQQQQEMLRWVKACPRCTVSDGFILSEEDLMNGGTTVEEEDDCAYELIVQCSSCSLWLRVLYYDLDDE